MSEERATYETEGIDEGGAKELGQALPGNDLLGLAELKHMVDFVTATLVNDTASSPTRRVRVNIAEDSMGYTTETTVEVTAHGDETDIETEIRDLLGIADTTARDEIDIRERIDAGDAGTRSRYRVPHDPPSP